MTLAIILVVAAALGLALILRVTVFNRLQISSSKSLAGQIEPIDVEAFRNLVDPLQDDYLRRRLPPSQFRMVQRERLRAAAAYVRVASHNATALVIIGQAALAAGDARTTEAARQLVDNALLLRRNATLVLIRINIAMAWPTSRPLAAPILNGYERLNGSAMLLGRLTNPAVPVRIAAS